MPDSTIFLYSLWCLLSIYLSIIKSSWLCGFSWLSLSIHPNHPLLCAGLPNYIMRLHRADVKKSSYWSTNTGSSMQGRTHKWRSSMEGVHWRTSHVFILAFPAVSRMSCSSYLNWFLRWEGSGRTAVVLCGVTFRICSR